MEAKPEEKTATTAENGDEKPKEKGAGHDIDYGDPEEDDKVKAAGLKDVEKTTGTEGEVCIYKQRIKLYRFSKEEWKERGVGNCKMMRNDADKKIRFVMRQEKTLKVIANFALSAAPMCVLTNMNNNEKAYMWSCGDCSDKAEGEVTKLAARFQNVDAAKDFAK